MLRPPGGAVMSPDRGGRAAQRLPRVPGSGRPATLTSARGGKADQRSHYPAGSPRAASNTMCEDAWESPMAWALDLPPGRVLDGLLTYPYWTTLHASSTHGRWYYRHACAHALYAYGGDGALGGAAAC